MSYTVSKKGSNPIVKFSCPTCAAPLESPLEEAGKRFPCPNCGNPFATPGVEELTKLRDEKAEAREAKVERARIAAKVEYEANLLAQAQEEDRQRVERENQNDQQHRSIDYNAAPHYDGILFGAGLLRVRCLLTWGTGVIGLFASVNQGNEIAGLLVLGYMVVAGALLWMAASIGLAIRDMARNSFRR